MRDHSSHICGTRHEVVGALMERWDFVRETEVVPLAEANGRVVAKTVTSRNTLPSSLTSNMDAIAVRFDDFADGMPDISAWERGVQWQFCNTGVAVPEGFDTAIAIEQVEVEGDKLTALNAMPAERFQMTTEEGASLQPGDVLARAGEILEPTLLAALAMGGYAEVEVVRKPRVAFIPTGNELVPASVELPRGKNVESNSAMINAKIAAWGGVPVPFDIVPDDPDKILAALRDAAERADIVAINAGSSKGSDDWTCEILEREGEILFHEVNQGPGRHCSFALLDGKPVIGISGPPIGAEFTADFFCKPFVDLYLGANLDFPPTVHARMLDSAPMNPRPVNVVKRVVVRRDEFDRFVAWTLHTYDRPVIRDCAEGNGLVTVTPDSYGWEEGDIVEVELRWPYTLPPRLER